MQADSKHFPSQCLDATKETFVHTLHILHDFAFVMETFLHDLKILHEAQMKRLLNN